MFTARGNSRKNLLGLNLIYNIQALRGIAAFLVLLIHLMSTHPSVSIGKLHHLFGWVGPVGVDIFFVISGFVVTLCANKASERKDFKNAFNFIMKRLLRVYPLYWVVFIAASIFGANLYLSPEWLPKESEINLFFLLKETNYKVMAAWTLHYELYFYLLLGFVLILAPVNFWKSIAVIAVIQMAVFIFTKLHWLSGYESILFSSGFLIEFTLGGIIAFLFKTGHIYKPKLSLILGLILFSIAIYSHANFAETYWSIEWRIFFAISSAFLIYGFIGLEVKDKYVLPKFIQSLGDCSYSLYVWHQFIFACLFYWFSQLSLIPESKLLLVLMLSMWMLIALAVGKLSYTFIEKPIMSLASRKFN